MEFLLFIFKIYLILKLKETLSLLINSNVGHIHLTAPKQKDEFQYFSKPSRSKVFCNDIGEEC